MSKLHLALLEVQKDIKPVKKTADNPFFHSKYADLEAVVEAVMPILSKHGLVCVQATGVFATGQPYLMTSLVHAETGERIDSQMPIIAKDSTDPQKVIAGLTYMRRASLTTICGLATQDDDGNTATGNEKPSAVSKVFKTPQPMKPNPTPTAKEEGKSEGAKKQIVPTSVVFDTKNRLYIVKTEKDGDFYTEREVLAKLAKMNLNKSINIKMTVDAEFHSIILDIMDAVPF